MTERLRSGSYVNSNISAKMPKDLSTRKTVVVLVIVVACFAVLLPKVFYPMLVGSAKQHMKPSPIDKTTGCCDVISETDVNTIKIMSELCRSIIKRDDDTPLTGREIVAKCQSAVLETCGIDISAVLQEQVKLGQTVKQILDEVRSLNGSLCLKYNFGVSPWRLGVPHRVTIMPTSPNIKQERPLHLRSEQVHPAFRERGRAIPQPQVDASPSRPAPRIIEGRPGPIPAMRPTMGGPGHVVPPSKQTSNMGLIMPIYTVGIVLFFAYTVLKLVLKNQPEALYPPVDPDPYFRREVFEKSRSCSKLNRENAASKLGDAELDQLRRRLRETELAMERIVEQMAKVPLKLQDVVANGSVVNSKEEDQPTVKVLGMEMTASCEGGKKWSRPDSPVLPLPHPQAPEPVEPPQEIYLEGALPAQSHLLVADSATEAQKTNSEEDPAVVLAGKMTLSVISLDSSENGTDESSNSGKKQSERSSSNASDDFEKIEIDSQIVDQIDNIIEEAQLITGLVKKQEEPNILEQLENELKKIEGESIITKLKQLGEPELNIEERFISGIVEKIDENLSLDDFLAKEIIESEKLFEQEIVDKNGIQGEDQSFEPGPKSEVTGNVEAEHEEKDVEEIKDVPAKENVKENVLREQDLSTVSEGAADVGKAVAKEINAEDIKVLAEEIKKEDVKAIPEEINTENVKAVTEEINKEDVKAVAEEINRKKEEITVTKPDFDLDPLESVIASLTSEIPDVSVKKEETAVDLYPEENKPVEKQTEIVTEEREVQPATIEDTKKIEVKPVGPVGNGIKEQTLIFTEKEKEESRKDVQEKEFPGNDLKIGTAQEKPSEAVEDTTKSETVKDTTENRQTEDNISATEKETFEKLNEAIADLSSEFRSTDVEEKERLEHEEVPEEEEDIEYEEYEVTDDDEDVDEEIRNVDRAESLVDQESVEHVNGDDPEQSKYATTSSATLAENEISDEENLENDDDEEEEIEEIIEYITDDEEEADEEVQPADRNNVNHVNDRNTHQQH